MYANLSNRAVIVNAPGISYSFPPLGYYTEDAALVDAVTAGVLTDVPDTYPTTQEGAVLATVATTYTSTDVAALQAEVEARFDAQDVALATIDTNVDEALEEILDVERHIHNVERWIGTGANLAIKRNSLTPFSVTAGVGVFGAETDILTAADLGHVLWPLVPGMTIYDPHKIDFVAAANADPWRFRLVYGSGTYNEAEAAGQWSEIFLNPSGIGNNISAIPIIVKMPRVPSATTKLWASAANGQAHTLTFFVGLHFYPE